MRRFFFFRQKNIAVVGGGDSAMEEATFLTRFADKVTVIHRKDSLRASKIMQDRATNDPKIEFAWNKEVTAIQGDSAVTGVTLKDTVTGEESELALDGLFIAIGNDPRTHLIHGQIDIAPEGTIAVQGRSSKTNLPGVFAAVTSSTRPTARPSRPRVPVPSRRSTPRSTSQSSTTP